LSLTNVQVLNEGDYRVVVSNLAGSITSAPAALTLILPVTIQKQPQSQTATAGGLAPFSVVAGGTGPWTYQWRFNGVDIPGANNSFYTLSGAQKQDAGDYQVLINNAAGPVLSEVAVLTVSSAVTILTQPQSQTVTNGGSVVFSVEVTGTPPINAPISKSRL
jgi:hypothetical protein